MDIEKKIKELMPNKEEYLLGFANMTNLVSD